MSTITDIQKIDGGYEYTLATPIPVGGYMVLLDGATVKTGHASSKYKHSTGAATPPPLEFVAAISAMDATPSFYAGNQITIGWDHVSGATHYCVEIAIDGGAYSVCDVQRYSGGLRMQYQATDITADATIAYRVTPGLLIDGQFTGTSIPITNIAQRIYLPPPPLSTVQSVVAGVVQINRVQQP